jgi:hypothetical protein
MLQYNIKIKIGIVGGGVQLGPLDTAATNRSIVPAPGDYDDGEIGGMIGRGNRSTRRKPTPMPLCPPQTPHAARTRTRAAAVGRQRLTAWATARLQYNITRIWSITAFWLFTTTCSRHLELPSISGGFLLYLQPDHAPWCGYKGPNFYEWKSIRLGYFTTPYRLQSLCSTEWDGKAFFTAEQRVVWT